MSSLPINTDGLSLGSNDLGAGFSVERRLLTWSRTTVGVLGCVVCVACYVGLIQPAWHPYPDSATYLLLGRSLSGGFGYAVHGVPHSECPPGFPAYLALMMRLGLDNNLTLNAMMVSMALAALLASYALLCQVTTRLIALFSVLVVAYSHEAFRLSGAQLSDVPFFAVVTVGLWLYVASLERRGKYFEIASLLLIGACWVRIAGIPLAIGAAIGLIWQAPRAMRRRAVANGAIVLVGVVATVMTFVWRDRMIQLAWPLGSFGVELSALANKGPIEMVGQSLLSFRTSSVELARFITGQPLAAVLCLLLFWMPLVIGARRSWRERHYVIVGATCMYLIVVTLMTRTPLARFYLPVAPVLIFWLGRGIRQVWLALGNRRVRPSAVALAGALLVMGMNFPKDVRLIYREHHPDRVQLEGNAAVYRAAAAVRDSVAPGGVFISERYAGVISWLAQRPYQVGAGRALWPQQRSAALRSVLSGHQIQTVLLWKANAKPQGTDVDSRVVVLIEAGFRLQLEEREFFVFRRRYSECDDVLQSTGGALRLPVSEARKCSLRQVRASGCRAVPAAHAG